MSVPGNMIYDDIIKNFITWAEAENSIRAAVVVGSRARTDHPADQWSDLDICIYANEFDSYLGDTSWAHRFAPVWTKIISRTAGGDPECLVLYEGARQVDYVFSAMGMLQSAATEGWVPYGFRRGAKVLVDKDGVATKVVPEVFTAPVLPMPTEDEYHTVINHFWFGVVYLAKQLRRGEFCYFHLRSNALLEPIIKMTEWHARAINGEAYDTWHMGRFLEEWADPGVVRELTGIFGRYGETEGWKSLLESAKLFRRLSLEIAAKLKFNYPGDMEGQVSEWVERCYKGSF